MTTIRELKKDAKVRLSGSYFKLLFIYFLYMIIVFAFSALANFINSNIIKLVYSIIILIFTVPLSYGFIACFMDIIRGKKVAITEFINVGLKSISSVWKVYLRIFLKLIIPILFVFASMFFLLLTLANTITGGVLANYFILSVVIFMIAVVVLFVMYIYYSFCLYLLKDKSEKTSKEIVQMSHDLMKGNIIKYIGLTLSFIGWYLLIFAIGFLCTYVLPQNAVSLIMEIGFLLLFPYITTTMIGFYEDILYDKTNAAEKENS